MQQRMPLIASCAAADCSYNRYLTCNAMAVTIGMGVEPVCDTFYQTDHRIAYPETVSFVGACKMESCRFNRYLECTAFFGVSLVGDRRHVICNTCELPKGEAEKKRPLLVTKRTGAIRSLLCSGGHGK